MTSCISGSWRIAASPCSPCDTSDEVAYLQAGKQQHQKAHGIQEAIRKWQAYETTASCMGRLRTNILLLAKLLGRGLAAAPNCV